MKSSEKKGSSSESKGITLIALIVNIIVLLILAGVTLNMVLDKNGLINKAQSAVSAQNVAAIKEALELEKTELYLAKGSLNIDDFIEQITTGNKSFTVDSIDKISDTELEIVINGDNKFIIKDNGKGDLDIAYKGVAQVADLTLSATCGIYTYPNSGTFTVTNNKSGGALSVTSESPDVATAIISGNTVTVTPGTTAGKARIIVTSAAVGEYAEKTATYTATVENGTISVTATPYTGAYDGQAHNAVTVTTVPSDASKEYSLNSAAYTTTMPTVREQGSYTIAVKVSKTGYKTETVTSTVSIRPTVKVSQIVNYNGMDFKITKIEGKIATIACQSDTANLALWTAGAADASGVAAKGEEFLRILDETSKKIVPPDGKIILTTRNANESDYNSGWLPKSSKYWLSNWGTDSNGTYTWGYLKVGRKLSCYKKYVGAFLFCSLYSWNDASFYNFYRLFS